MPAPFLFAVRVLIVVLVSFLVAWPAGTLAGDATVTIEARDFDGGNPRVSLTGGAYADGPACIWNGGELPNWVDYDIRFSADGDCTLSALYAAAQARPVVILVDGVEVHTGLGGVTGSWKTSSARWEEQCTLHFSAGVHTITLQCAGPFPHICGLRLKSLSEMPQGFERARLGEAERSERRRRIAEREQRKARIAALEGINTGAVRLAIDDMEQEFPGLYDAARYRQILVRFESSRLAVLRLLAEGEANGAESADELLDDIRTILLANPLLDFDKLLVVKRNFGAGRARTVESADAGFVAHNFQNQTSLPRKGWDNEIAVLSNLRGKPSIDRLYRPSGDQIVRDVRVEYSGQRMLFSSIDQNDRWAVYEIGSDGNGLRQLSPDDYPDLDFFDACYLPDGRIVLCSTGGYIGLPCLDGVGQVASLYLMSLKNQELQQLTFDQDSDNDPTVLNDGRVLYQRWEYGDIPHYFSRRRMTMNPDGTRQLALHGSNSWFPTALRFARAVPDHPTRLVGVISGHHDHGDCGRLVLLDPGLAGAYPFHFRPKSKEWGVEGEPIAVTPDVLPAEQTGFLQLIPGYGKAVAGTVCDAIIGHVYRKEHTALATHP